MRIAYAAGLIGVVLLAGCSYPATDSRTLVCPEGLTGTLRFPDPETLELKMSDGNSQLLERQRTASGARYTGSGIDFWNKGDEVMLTIAERRYSCVID